jgi:REP element-mobilizing transposase RayT
VGVSLAGNKPEKRHRRSLRLPRYDYASPGAYFVTICAHARLPLFEDPVLKGIIERTWHGQQERSADVALDSLCVMPNHIHFIVWLNSVGAPLAGARDANPMTRAGASPAPTLAEVVGAFKSMVATEWLKWLEQNAPHRSGRVWQRNYYERVIRNEDELSSIREYIHLNP